MGEVTRVARLEGLTKFGVRMPPEFCAGLARGASVSVAGVCLTALEQEGDTVFFEAMGETLERTTFGSVAEADRVNVERSVQHGAEIGGHLVSGHVDGIAEIIAIEDSANNRVMTFRPPKPLMKYIFSKGFVALDGTSLTIVDADFVEGIYKVWFIPETLRVTTFGFKKVGDHVNCEIDAQTRVLVETAERSRG